MRLVQVWNCKAPFAREKERDAHSAPVWSRSCRLRNDSESLLFEVQLESYLCECYTAYWFRPEKNNQVNMIWCKIAGIVGVALSETHKVTHQPWMSLIIVSFRIISALLREVSRADMTAWKKRNLITSCLFSLNQMQKVKTIKEQIEAGGR